MAKQDKTPKFPTWRPKSAGMTVAQKRQAAIGAQKTKVPAKKQGFDKNKPILLGEVTVMSPKKPVDTRSQAATPSIAPRAIPKAPVDSTAISKVKAPVLNTTAAGPKKLGRLATAASDATSAIRGAANLALGKNQSKTTGGKILERAARVGVAALGAGVAKKAAVAGATKAITTAAKAGTVNPIGHAIGTAGTVAAGQIGYKNRSAESTRTGLLNPGKGKANLPINFDKPFQLSAPSDSTKKQVRNSTPLGDTQFND